MSDHTTTGLPLVHSYKSTTEAYDASQVSERVHDGDVLAVPYQGAYAVLCGAWPVAVGDQPAHSAFHQLADGMTWDQLDGGRYATSAALARDLARVYDIARAHLGHLRRQADVAELGQDVATSARHQAEEQERAWLTQARQLGQEAGRTAATWATDGNTDEATYLAGLAALEAGDPRADELMPARPNLSGEWADQLTPSKLAEQVTGMEAEDLAGQDPELAVALCDAWEAGVDDTFTDAVEAEWRKALGQEQGQ